MCGTDGQKRENSQSKHKLHGIDTMTTTPPDHKSSVRHEFTKQADTYAAAAMVADP